MKDGEDGKVAIKLICNSSKGSENEVLILANNLGKYDCAIHNIHEILAQVNEEYKKYCWK